MVAVAHAPGPARGRALLAARPRPPPRARTPRPPPREHAVRRLRRPERDTGAMVTSVSSAAARWRRTDS
ncbi:hypothetical protein, partial [Nocardia carnea]|uniref:hypothetical protein n=1 Tax=Nocardia carnea TaxID=37328 RepID=UPI002458D17C